MQLLELELNNFRQHGHTSLNFREGITAIVGPNGSGKSTLLEAITFALYNEHRENRDSIKNLNSEAVAQVFVRLKFALGGDVYEVKRNLKNAHLHQILPDGKERSFAEGSRPTVEACTKLLGLGYLHFTTSFFAEQKALAFLSSMNKEVRQREVGKMLGLESIKNAANTANDHKRKASNQLEAFQGQLSLKDESALKASLRHLATKIKILETQVAEHEKAITEHAKGLAEATQRTKSAKEWLDSNTQYNELKLAMKEQDAQLATFKKEIESLEKMAEERATLTEAANTYVAAQAADKEWQSKAQLDQDRTKLEVRLNLLHSQIEANTKALGNDSSAEVASADESLKASVLTVTKLEQEIADAEKAWNVAVHEASVAYAGARSKVAHLNEDVNSTTELLNKGACPQCGQPWSQASRDSFVAKQVALTAAQTELDGLEVKVKELAHPPAVVTQGKAKLADCKKDVEVKRTELDALKRLQDAFLKGKQALEAAQLQADQLAGTLAATPKAYHADKHDEVKRVLDKNRVPYERWLALGNCEENLARARTNHKLAQDRADETMLKGKTLREAMQKLGYPSRDEALVAERSLDLHQNKAQGLEKDLKLKQTELQAEIRAAEGLEKEIANIASVRELAASAQADFLLYDTIQLEMKKLLEKLNAQLIPDLVYRTSHYLNILTQGRYAEVEIKSDYEATIKDDSVAKAVISGGEEDVLALSLRLAFCEMIQERSGKNHSLLVLDEVFGSLDASRRVAVQDQLRALSQQFRQILVISHIEEVNEIADYSITVNRDEITKTTVIEAATIDMPEFSLV